LNNRRRKTYFEGFRMMHHANSIERFPIIGLKAVIGACFLLFYTSCSTQQADTSYHDELVEIYQSLEQEKAETSISSGLDINYEDYKNWIIHHKAKPLASMTSIMALAHQDITESLIKISYIGDQNYPVRSLLLCSDGNIANLWYFVDYHLLYGNDMLGPENIKLFVIDKTTFLAILKNLSAKQDGGSGEKTVSISVFSRDPRNGHASAAELLLDKQVAIHLHGYLNNLLIKYPSYVNFLNTHYNPLIPFGNN
jgi:hypothetical protein